MRGDTVVLLALLTRALNPCCRSFSLGDAERQNEQRERSENTAVKDRRALTCTTGHVPVACNGCLVEKCQFTHMMILSVEKLEVIPVQVIISRHPILCPCEVLNIWFLGVQNKLEPNQTTPGLPCKAFNKLSHSSLKYIHVNLLLMKSTSNYCFYLKNGSFLVRSWKNGPHILCDVKNHLRGMDCVCFRVHMFMAAEDQVNGTDEMALCVRSGAWFMSANRLTMILPGVKLHRPAVKVLIGTFLKQTEDWTIPSLICVFTTMQCQLVLSHSSLCVISLMRGNCAICTYSHCAVYQFIWNVSLEKMIELNQMAKSCSVSYMHTCTDMWKHKELSPLQWQVCTILSRGLVHQWIMRVLLITVGLFLISQTAALTYMSYTQRLTFTQRVRNSNQSFILLFTISWCSLSPLAVTGQSNCCSCKLHHTAFGITFVFCISCVLGKTIVVLMAFKATFPGSNVPKWSHRLSVLALTITQILVFVVCFLIYSNSFKLSKNCYHENMLSATDFCSFDHLLSFIVTFLACNLPYTMACYSVLNIYAIMGGITRISLRALFR